MGQSITYDQIETGDHGVILAYRAASETFPDMPDRRSFDNYREYPYLYEIERMVPEMVRPLTFPRRRLLTALEARAPVGHDVSAG